MLARRIIPCLDVANGRVVKGVHFESLRDAGDPVEQGAHYDAEGADELVFLDIAASYESRSMTLDMVSRVADRLFIPFTVGGGIRTVADAGQALRAGADKVAVNTAAVRDPDLVRRLAESFGSQCVVAAVDSRRVEGRDVVMVTGGREPTERTAVEWAAELEERGAGKLQDLADALAAGAHGVLAASIFHFRGSSLAEARAYLRSKGYPVRP